MFLLVKTLGRNHQPRLGLLAKVHLEEGILLLDRYKILPKLPIWEHLRLVILFHLIHQRHQVQCEVVHPGELLFLAGSLQDPLTVLPILVVHLLVRVTLVLPLRQDV